MIVRKFYPWWLWECFENGFYRGCSGKELEKEKSEYRDFFASGKFEQAIIRLMGNWPISCEQFLTNDKMNRTAWIGQASACLDSRLSSMARGGFNLLDKASRKRQNETAKKYLKEWLSEYSKNRSGELYKRVDEARLRKRHSRRVTASLSSRGVGTILQGDLFSDFK